MRSSWENLAGAHRTSASAGDASTLAPAPAGASGALPGVTGAAQGHAPSAPPLVLPTPSLPTGGGAIRGIGEQFAVSALTGTASMSIPLGVTPGRGAVTPGLALVYDSGAGNSAFGLGWDVAGPRV